jgi:hypothetical protein
MYVGMHLYKWLERKGGTGQIVVSNSGSGSLASGYKVDLTAGEPTHSKASPLCESGKGIPERPRSSGDN